MARSSGRPSTHSLKVGDQIVVTRDGRDYPMTVSRIVPPMTGGRRESAGPLVTAHIRPGGWSVTFDDHSTTLTWRHG